MNTAWNEIPSDDILKKTAAALTANGIATEIFDTGAHVKEKVLSLLPKDAEVMNMTSVTLDTLGLTKEIMESGNYNSVKKKLFSMNRETQGLEMQKLGSAPEWTVGSVHAVTQDGKVLIASNTGSQLPAYVYASPHVIFIVGAQKVVENVDEGIKRIYEYVLPLESERANKVYHMTSGSSVNKLLIINKEVVLGRITLFLVKESLGF